MKTIEGLLSDLMRAGGRRSELRRKRMEIGDLSSGQTVGLVDGPLEQRKDALSEHTRCDLRDPTVVLF
jgi:hypothetical protein